MEALSVGWRGWVAITNVANVSQIGALDRAVVVVARSVGRVTEIVGTTIVIVTEGRWQVLAASLLHKQTQIAILTIE